MTRRAVILTLAALFCLAAFGMTGCGQKGPLKLPEPVTSEPAQAEQTEHEQK